MAILTLEQRQLLHQGKGEPLRLVDPETNKEYVLLQADVYERLAGLLGEIEPREMYGKLGRTLQDDGWDSARMDEYNRYG